MARGAKLGNLRREIGNFDRVAGRHDFVDCLKISLFIKVATLL